MGAQLKILNLLENTVLHFPLLISESVLEMIGYHDL